MADKASSQQTADALFLLNALQHVTSTVMINAGEIAAQKGAKVNTIQKRFTTLKQRYNLNIQATAVGSGGAAAGAPTNAKAAKVTKTRAPKKTAAKKTSAAKTVAIAEQLEKSDKGTAKAAVVKREDAEEEEEMGSAEEDVNSNDAEGDSDMV